MLGNLGKYYFQSKYKALQRAPMPKWVNLGISAKSFQFYFGKFLFFQTVTCFNCAHHTLCLGLIDFGCHYKDKTLNCRFRIFRLITFN